jgi:hypothetical protein
LRSNEYLCKVLAMRALSCLFLRFLKTNKKGIYYEILRNNL